MKLLRSLVPALLALGACAGSIDGPGAAGEDLDDTAVPGGGTGVQPGSPGAAPPPATGGVTPAPAAKLDPGRVVLRRLNRAEYNNTVRDLLGTSLRPADRFPGDEVDHGFDTIGAALGVSPALIELAEAAAGQLVDELLALPAGEARRARVLSCATPDDACLRQALTGFARRAYRRPVSADEVSRLVALAGRVRTATGRAEDGLRAALQAVLVSPHFLYRVERDPDPRSSAPHPVNDHELATRLSYFLWASMPDDALQAAADAGRLSKDPAELGRQLARMLADRKAQALAHHFAGQWLFTRAIDEFEPQRAVYRAYDDRLRASMKTETETFFEALVREDHPLERLLTADFTFVNDRLARHYGLPAGTAEFRRTPVAGTPRGGLLTHGSFLLMTSQPDRTSPVKRGAWVLEQLLCTTPPPPPPEVEAFEPPKPGDGTTLRQRLEAHRRNPECAACHNLIDPIGLGLESYDGIGAHRTLDNGRPIDASGTLLGGDRFSGAHELQTLLARDGRFADCVMEQLLTYGVGRDFKSVEGHAYVADLARRARAQGGTWKAALAVAVTSEAFRSRRGGGAP